ncbi:MAG TPA: hypothetical protein VG429_11600 [Casimicrobiaceae bacterium]|jgi:hypothetical protein|nr:hypothetical protein [Casimicrobiaceae bacterium]
MTQSSPALVAVFAFAANCAFAAPLSTAELQGICAQAEDTADCGRRVEAMQLKRLPNLARREGNVLSVSLYPSGTTTFTDSDDPVNGRSYSLWDYLDGLNAVLLYTTAGETTTFTLVQRATDRRIELPTEPQLAPDRARLVTADVCESRCSNEIAVWRVTREGIRKELAWSPAPDWIDAGAKWRDADTLSIEYTTRTAGGKLERTLGDATWKHVP